MIELKFKQLCYEEKETIKLSNFNSINYIETGDIEQNKIFSYSNLRVGIDKIPSRARKVAKKGQIVFSLVRPNQRHYGIVDENWPLSLVVSTGFAVIQSNKEIDPYYLYYLLTQENNINRLQKIAEQSVTSYPSIVFNDIGNLKVRIYSDLRQQKEITNLLRAIDGKITTNQKINDNLSQLIDIIFRHFFMQKIKMHVGNFESILNYYDAYQPKTISNSSLNDIFPFPVYGGGGLIGKYNEYNHEQEEVIISCRGSCGKTYFTEPYSWITGNAMVIQPKTKFLTKEYIFSYLKNIGVEKFLSGSVQKQLTRENLKNLEIYIPLPIECLEFTKLVKNYHKKIFKLAKENDKLKKIRDYLIPLLLNGQVIIG